MKRLSLALAAVLTLGIAAFDADAARRFGGGGNVGKQRPAPTAKEAAPAQSATPPASTPAGQPAQAAPKAPAAAAPAAPAAKPSFMQRWGGLLAGLGIGALLASLFGAQLGPIIGMLLAVLLVAAIAFALYRLFAGKRNPPVPGRAQFAGLGSSLPPAAGEAPNAPASGLASSEAPMASRRAAIAIPGFEVAPFVRVAKTSFIRLQAANDAGDLDDIRDYPTPEMFAEISMQVRERNGAPQKTEVVSLDADVVEAVVEDGWEIATVRFWGLIRENDAKNPEPFDEMWNVRRKAGDRKSTWLISGIQQSDPA